VTAPPRVHSIPYPIADRTVCGRDARYVSCSTIFSAVTCRTCNGQAR
jgi:hypothetical protein